MSEIVEKYEFIYDVPPAEKIDNKFFNILGKEVS